MKPWQDPAASVPLLFPPRIEMPNAIAAPRNLADSQFIFDQTSRRVNIVRTVGEAALFDGQGDPPSADPAADSSGSGAGQSGSGDDGKGNRVKDHQNGLSPASKEELYSFHQSNKTRVLGINGVAEFYVVTFDLASPPQPPLLVINLKSRGNTITVEGVKSELLQLIPGFSRYFVLNQVKFNFKPSSRQQSIAPVRPMPPAPNVLESMRVGFSDIFQINEADRQSLERAIRTLRLSIFITFRGSGRLTIHTLSQSEEDFDAKRARISAYLRSSQLWKTLYEHGAIAIVRCVSFVPS
jgi:hypothetical protein